MSNRERRKFQGQERNDSFSQCQIRNSLFDKLVKHRHLKALYVKGFVDGKLMSKMLVDGGAFVNLMSYTTFRKLGKGLGDLIETDMMLKDFGGNTSKTGGQ